MHTSSRHSAHTPDKHAGHHTADFLKKFWISLVLTIPLVLYSEVVRETFNLPLPEIPLFSYVELILGSIVFFFGGWVFLEGAYREIRNRLPGMMMLIALAITAAYAWSVYVVLFGAGHTLFWELATLITIMLLGHWIEMKAVAGAEGALKELAKLLPDTAEVIRGDKTERIPLSELREGDTVLIKPGSKVPADGVIAEGKSDMNESVITGESKPVLKQAGDGVIAGSLNGDGSLKVKVSQIGEKTFLAGVMRLVAEAEASKSRLQVLSDRAALYLTVVAVAAGTATFFAWIFAEAGIEYSIERLVAVLVIACPHALGLAVPLVAAISTTMAARNGLLIKQRLALEAARSITVVLFDKTGTLTKGSFGVDAVFPAEGKTEGEVLAVAASVNQESEHPLAQAIVEKAKNSAMALMPLSNFERVAGMGARAYIGGKEAVVGNEKLLEEKHIKIPQTHTEKANVRAKEGKTIIHVAHDGILIGSIALGDVIREESKKAVEDLKSLGVRTAMITGDSEDVAAWVAQELGIDEYFARVLPGEKAERVRALQEKGDRVAMVGDGVNDAPALTQADLGIAIGAGTNVAIESAGIILVKSDPRDIPKIIRLSKLTYRKMIQNLWWASGYNIVALPLAAGALAFAGIILEPAVAAILMSASTVIVAVNAVLLRRKKLA